MAVTRMQIPDARSSAQQFLEEHELLQKELAHVKQDNVNLSTDNANLLSEVNMLRAELALADKDRMRLQGYAIGLKTRMDVIVETIGVAARQAAEFKLETPPDRPAFLRDLASEPELPLARQPTPEEAKLATAVSNVIQASITGLPSNKL